MIDNNFRPCPKPASKKKKKLENGYKDKPNRCCFYTGAAGAERHEVYGGPNRETSIRYKFQVDLCQEIHERFHNPQTAEDHERILYWKQFYQKKFEQNLIDQNMPEENAREFFRMLIGKSYL